MCIENLLDSIVCYKTMETLTCLRAGLQTQDDIMAYTAELTKQMEKFNQADAVASQWLQHRDGERSRLEAEIRRLQVAVEKSKPMNFALESDLQMQMKTLNSAWEYWQVHSLCFIFLLLSLC